MAEGKKSFVLYSDQRGIFDKLNNEQAGLLIKHIFAYVNDENPEGDFITELAFESIMRQLKRDLVKYESRADRSRENGSKGGRPKNPEEPKEPSGLINNPDEPRKPDTVNVTVTDNGTVNGNDTVTEKKNNSRLLVQLSDESGLNENEKIAFAFWKLFKKNILESGISKTATLDRAKLCLWTNNIRLIIDLDGRTHDELTNVWNYLNSDDSAFWKKNILSTATLREKFERLYMEAKEKQYKSTGKISTEYLQKLHQRLYGN
jgi:hypothetical protein